MSGLRHWKVTTAISLDNIKISINVLIDSSIIARFYETMKYPIVPIVYGVHNHYDKICAETFLHQCREIWKYETTGRLLDSSRQERQVVQRILLVETAFWGEKQPKRWQHWDVSSMRRSPQHDATNKNLSRYDRLVGKSIKLSNPPILNFKFHFL